MSKILDDDVVSLMLGFVNSLHETERPSGRDDLLFLKDDTWLGDTAVIDLICHRKGAWEVSLTFAHYKIPLKLIVRKIVTCYSEEKAKTAAFYVRRQAAKDTRGTLEVDIKDFHLCTN
jgi:hypothetical protein